MLDLYEELKNLAGLLEKEQIPYALCGGLAVAIYGFSRATEDIDILMLPEDLERLDRVIAFLGYQTPANCLGGLGQGYVVIHRYMKSDTESDDFIVLDVLEVTSIFQQAWLDRQEVHWEKIPIKIVSKESLIHMKHITGRSQDRIDIERLSEGEMEEKQ